jgi:hypothetical protein
MPARAAEEPHYSAALDRFHQRRWTNEKRIYWTLASPLCLPEKRGAESWGAALSRFPTEHPV